jgi:DNA repair protein RecN (Recombination protein N)
MIKELRLTNIILVESAEITFTHGFNVLSGESGSGKSAILNALHLIAGVRSDTGLIRRGADKGIVEACFDIDNLPILPHLLKEAGIDHAEGDDLLIRREIHTSGKSRAFVNNQAAQLSILKQISDHLFEIVGQHANQKLLSTDHHRHLLDLYSDLKGDIATFSNIWEEETQTRQLIDELKNSQAERLRTIEVCRMEIEELESAAIKEGEDEELFAEYTHLSNTDQLAEKVREINDVLSGEKIAILAHLSRQKSTLEELVTLDPVLSEVNTSYQNALLELQEVAYSLRNYETRIEHDPTRVEFLEERLSLIARLKKKYGSSIDEMHAYLAKAHDKLTQLESSDLQIESLEEKLKGLSTTCNNLGSQLTRNRQQASKIFATGIVKHLIALNMPKVQFVINITPQKRSRNGDDKIEFFIVPNIGEHQVSVCDCASGGELSRTMIALQALLAGKEQTPTIIFDEVDANIGGETANVVGEKLNEIGQKHQVLCITHFPQVAKYADHHLHIYKTEIDGRTITQVNSLDSSARQKELARMRG